MKVYILTSSPGEEDFSELCEGPDDVLWNGMPFASLAGATGAAEADSRDAWITDEEKWPGLDWHYDPAGTSRPPSWRCSDPSDGSFWLVVERELQA